MQVGEAESWPITVDSYRGGEGVPSSVRTKIECDTREVAGERTLYFPLDKGERDAVLNLNVRTAATVPLGLCR